MFPALHCRLLSLLVVALLSVSGIQADLPSTRDEFLRIDRVWDLEMELPPELGKRWNPDRSVLHSDGHGPIPILDLQAPRLRARIGIGHPRTDRVRKDSHQKVGRAHSQGTPEAFHRTVSIFHGPPER